MVKLEHRPGTTERSSRFASEVELTSAAASGDRAARQELVERLLDGTRRKIGYLVAGDRDADDMTQLALVEVLESAGTFRGDCSLRFWADRITTRTAMRELRRRKRGAELARSAGWTPVPERSGDEVADLVRVRARLATLLDKLTPERRVALILHHAEGYGIAEVAEITGAPINTVRDRLRVARRQLRKRLQHDPELRNWLNSRLR
jgi:RNA polymerase sigma-70 factor (ECF subfamily)